MVFGSVSGKAESSLNVGHFFTFIIFVHQMFDYLIIKPVATEVAHEEAHEHAK
jgi:hypothetical protein